MDGLQIEDFFYLYRKYCQLISNCVQNYWNQQENMMGCNGSELLQSLYNQKSMPIESVPPDVLTYARQRAALQVVHILAYEQSVSKAVNLATLLNLTADLQTTIIMLISRFALYVSFTWNTNVQYFTLRATEKQPLPTQFYLLNSKINIESCVLSRTTENCSETTFAVEEAVGIEFGGVYYTQNSPN